MKKLTLLFTLVLVSQIAFAQVPASFFTKVDTFLKATVTKGLVNYSEVKANPQALNDLLEMAAIANVSENRPNEFKAFYINTYNLIVIKKISDYYPINNPLKIDGLFDKIQITVAGKKTTLNGIENDILRKTYPKEARFHFALVCAGLGCPPIISEAYTPKKLENQLQQQTVAAINDPNFIREAGKNVKISKIFEWYAQDFKQYGSYIDFLNIYRKTPLKAKLNVSFYEYNWNLNDSK